MNSEATPDADSSGAPPPPEDPPISTSVCRVPADLLTRIASPRSGPPHRGDLVLVEVLTPGSPGPRVPVEGLDPRSGALSPIPVAPGVRFVAALGHRDAEDDLDARLPDTLAEELDLVAACGLVGRVTRSASGRVAPRVRILGSVVDASGAPINTRAHPHPALGAPPAGDALAAARLVVFTADKMNAGKSTAVLAAVEALVAAGVPVAAGRLTGTAGRAGLERLRRAGARAVGDFSDLGHASTAGLPFEELDEILDRLPPWLAQAAAGGVVLLELADGFRQRETAHLLASPRLRERLHRLVLCVSHPDRVPPALAAFERAVGLPVAAISGLAAAAPAASAAPVPVLDARIAPRERLADLLRG